MGAPTKRPGQHPIVGDDIEVISPWVALDRFIRDLERHPNVNDGFGTALATVCDSTNADLAFVYSDGATRASEMAGAASPSPQWCRELCRGLAARFPHGGFWAGGKDADCLDLPPGPVPNSAAILPIGSSRPSWLLAISLDPDRPLDESDFRIITVIWRLQVRDNRNVRHYENLKETLFGVVRCLSTAIDAKDPYTSGHSERVARIAVRLGGEMGLSRGEINDLYLAGLLHDVGKIGIRDDVLLKAGPLTAAEFAHIKEHPVTGERIISNVTRLAYLRPAIRGHHEQFNGNGYPDGLVGESIPLPARILAVADACDAMMSARRYRHALVAARIEATFNEGRGSQWDPDIVHCFFNCRRELYDVCERGLGQSVYVAIERAAGGGSQNVQASLAAALGVPA